ncbi:MAG: TolC family outer membrane protein [Pseudomonadota bacterium]
MRLLSWAACLSLTVAPAIAQTDELLRELVDVSPEVLAARDEAAAAKAELWAARGEFLPQVRIEAFAQSLEETLRIDGAAGELTATRDPRAVSAIVDQALFTSGRISGSIGAAKATSASAAHNRDATRQDVLLEGASAIADIVRDRAILQVRRENEAIVRRRLDESVARRRAGLATTTDVRQSEARLALATAEAIAANGALERSEALFIRVFGKQAPEGLTLPAASRPMPRSLDEALSTAFDRNPDLSASDDRMRAARQNVRAERGALLPQFNVTASASTIDNERFGIELGEAEQYSVTVNGRWNLLSGGSGYARTRAAKQRANAARRTHEVTERRVRETTIAAWADLLTARSSVSARQAQADAASVAAEGVAAEFRSGRRTRLDVLDADQERSDAQVALVAAQRDHAVAKFALLRATGQL